MRALICHPHLVPRCGVLVDVFRNHELRAFVESLANALVQHHTVDPRQALLRVPIAPRSGVARIFAELYHAQGWSSPDSFLSEQAASQLIEDFIQTLDQRPVQERLRELQRAINEATERGDHEEARRLLEPQAAIVRALATPGATPERLLLAAGEAPPRLRLVEPDGFDDAGAAEGGGQRRPSPPARPPAPLEPDGISSPELNDDAPWPDEPSWSEEDEDDAEEEDFGW